MNLFNAQPSLPDGYRHWNPISSVSDSQHLMPIITPELKQLKHDEKCLGNINTAECILESSLQLYEAEFERAYRIMRKVGKGKMKLNDLFGPYESFMTFSKEESAIKPDSGF